jgi:DNA-binding transcriptional ArsR family regulator
MDQWGRAPNWGVVADVSPSIASARVDRLKEARLVKSVTQGKHPCYAISDPEVARLSAHAGQHYVLELVELGDRCDA